jgi:hypothetical protein
MVLKLQKDSSSIVKPCHLCEAKEESLALVLNAQFDKFFGHLPRRFSVICLNAKPNFQ